MRLTSPLCSLLALLSLSAVIAADQNEPDCPDSSPKRSDKNHPNRIGSNTKCSTYTLLDTRGTHELQGPSAAFTIMNKKIMSTVPGGKVVNTVYRADVDQNSRPGSKFIVDYVNSAIASNTQECIILQGYSQGAAATTNALYDLTGAAKDAVKAVLLIGNPEHKSGLQCNVDNLGGTSTRDVMGQYYGAVPGIVPPTTTITKGIPAEWVGVTLDVCLFGDNVCDSVHVSKVHGPHAVYLTDPSTQNMGFDFITAALSGQKYKHV